MSGIGIAVTGYPGSGKSTAGDFLEDYLGGLQYETGNVVRRGASEYFSSAIESLSSDKLGEYSTMRRDVDGGDYVMQDILDSLREDSEFPEKPAIITGMRDSEVPKLCEDFFDEFLIVWIDADFKTRLHRLQVRGRQDEGTFTKDDLTERDLREDKWGTGDLYDQRNIVIENSTTLSQLHQRLKAVEFLVK